MGCATGLVKNLVFLLNFLCSIVGLVLIILGSIALVDLKRIDAATNQDNTFVPAFILSLGVLIFFISFLGCCGVCQRSQCMLTTYAVILILFFVTQLGLGIYGYTQIKADNSTSAKTELTKELELAFQNYTKDNSTREFFNDFQSRLECCGVKGPQDYEPVLFPSRYPGSCCGLPDTEYCVSPKYSRGCSEQLYDLINKSLKIVAYVALGICVTEIVAALFAICLVNSYRNEARRGI